MAGNRTANGRIRRALRLLDERKVPRTSSVSALKRKIAVGLAELRRGRSVDGEGFFQRLAARRRAERRRRD